MSPTGLPKLAPLLFQPSMEHLEDNEPETDRELDQQLAKVRETTFAHSGHATRSVHAKSHGLLRGTLTVLDTLPPVLAQGLFAHPGTYPAAMRFSTIPGDVLQDSVSAPRGVALKVIGVPGPRLPGSEADVTQDFVMVNGPAFAAPTAKKFLGNLKLLVGTTDKAEGAKIVLSHVLRAVEAVVEAFGGKSALIATLGGQQAVHILGETFYSQTPFLFGPYMAKFALAPRSPALTALTGAKLDIDAAANALRQAVRAYFAGQGGEWELRAQFCTDLAAMPIEDASVAWPEDKSPYVAVARLSCPKQDSWSIENRRAIEDGMAFSPWHGVAAHRPLGSVNRARQQTYANSAAFRGTHTGCPMHEPN
jgi:hypothetical protein